MTGCSRSDCQAAPLAPSVGREPDS